MTEQKQQKRQLCIILLIVFLGFVGISMPYLIFPALFLNPAYSMLPESYGDTSRALFLGLTLAAYPLGQFIGSPILGSLSDDYGRKKLLSGSLLIAALSNLFTGFAIAWQTLWLLIASRFVAGLMEGNIAIARAMTTDLTTIPKHSAFGKINAAAGIAYLLGPLLGGLMTEKDVWSALTISTPFYVTCVLFLFLAALSLLTLQPTTHGPRSSQTIWQRLNLLKRLSVLFSNKRLYFLMIISTSFTLAVDIFYEFGPVYLTVKWLIGPSELVLYNGALCLAGVVGSGWLPAFLSSRVSSRKAILASTAGLALFLLGMVLTTSPYIMLLLFLVSGLAIGVAVTLLTVKISDAAPNAIQGEVMGVQVSLRVLGDAIICLFGGALLLLSSKIILIIAAAISLLAMAYYAFQNEVN